MTDQQLVDQINWPEDIVEDQKDPIVVIVPADHERIDAQDAINDA